MSNANAEIIDLICIWCTEVVYWWGEASRRYSYPTFSCRNVTYTRVIRSTTDLQYTMVVHCRSVYVGARTIKSSFYTTRCIADVHWKHVLHDLVVLGNIFCFSSGFHRFYKSKKFYIAYNMVIFVVRISQNLSNYSEFRQEASNGQYASCASKKYPWRFEY